MGGSVLVNPIQRVTEFSKLLELEGASLSLETEEEGRIGE